LGAEGGRRRGGVKDGQSASRLPPGLREHVLAAKRQQRPKLKSVVAEATRAADPSAVDLEAGKEPDLGAEGGRRRGGVKDGQSASRLPPGLREHVLAAKRQQRPKGLKSVVAEATRAADPSAVDLEAGSTGMEPSSRKAQQPSQQQRANI